MLVYKILLPAEWAGFETVGSFTGSVLDRESGFIHLSTRAQAPATARRFFATAGPLVVLAVDGDAIASELRWEPASDGEPFPHLYAAMPLAAVRSVHRVADASAVMTLTGDG